MKTPTVLLANHSLRKLLCLSTALGFMQADFSIAEQGSRSFALEEVVVTARKRSENLQEIPLSVQVYSGDSLEFNRIDNVENLVGLVPNLSISSNLLSPGKDFLNIVVRGIGAQSAGTPAVGTFVDGAFVPALSFDIGFMDVERIEVLKGPQGTLFGRNTEGGALNIVLKRPDEETRGKVAFTFDEFETARVQSSIAGQLADKWYASVSTDVSRTEGYLENPVVANSLGAINTGSSVSANDDSRWSGRLALRYFTGDKLDINLAIDKSRRIGLDGYPGVPRGSEDYKVRSDFQIDAEYENTGGALNIEYSFGDVDFTSITAYRKVTSTSPFDFDGSPEFGPNFQDLRTDQELFSQELRASSTWGDNIDWIVGAYGFSEDSDTRRLIKFQDIVFGSLLVDAQDQSLSRSGFALFTDVVWHLTDNLELNVGVRYTEEDVESDVVLDFVAPVIGLVVDESGSAKTDDDNISSTVALRYSFSDNMSVYGRFAQGFRAGGFPVAPAGLATNIAFNSETTETFEFGIKGSALDGRLRYDLAYFNIDIQDQQVTTLVFINDDPNLPVASVDNAGESTSRGFEANLSAQVTERIALSASYGYTDAEYDSYVDTVGVDRSGEKFPFVPEQTFSLEASYVMPFKDGDLGFILKYRFVDEQLSGSGVDIDRQFKVDSYDLLDVAVRYTDDSWTAEFFVDNVSDDFIETRVFNAFFFAEDRPFSIVLPPRRAGIRVAYQF